MCACLVRVCCMDTITTMVVIVVDNKTDNEHTAAQTFINFSVQNYFDAPCEYRDFISRTLKTLLTSPRTSTTEFFQHKHIFSNKRRLRFHVQVAG